MDQRPTRPTWSVVPPPAEGVSPPDDCMLCGRSGHRWVLIGAGAGADADRPVLCVWCLDLALDLIAEESGEPRGPRLAGDDPPPDPDLEHRARVAGERYQFGPPRAFACTVCGVARERTLKLIAGFGGLLCSHCAADAAAAVTAATSAGA